MFNKKTLTIFLVLILLISGCTTNKEEVKEEVKVVVEEVKDAAGKVVDEVKEVSGEALDKAKEVAADVAGEVKEVAGEVKEEVKADAATSAKKYEDIKLSPQEAYEIFGKKYPEMKIDKIQLDWDDDQYVYEVKGFDQNNWLELDIHPVSGEILKDKSGTRNDKYERTELTLEQVKKVQAMVDKVLAENAGATLDEWTLKYDNGRTEIEVEIDLPSGQDIDYTYDVDTGELLEIDD